MSNGADFASAGARIDGYPPFAPMIGDLDAFGECGEALTAAAAGETDVRAALADEGCGMSGHDHRAGGRKQQGHGSARITSGSRGSPKRSPHWA